MSEISLSSSSMLSRLSISVYTGRKLDKKVTDEVAVNKGAQGRVGNYHKSLFADSPKLDAIVKLAAKVRNWHQANTLPWEDDGSRLLPTKHFFDHREQMGKFETEFNQAVDDFLNDYNNQISIQAFKLGAMFDKNEYPDVNSLRRKYAFSIVYSPVPESGHFIVDVGNEARQELIEQYEGVYTERVQGAMQDAWQRLHKVLSHIADRLTPDANGDQKTFHKTMIENGLELTELLDRFNIMNDPKLEDARKEVHALLSTVTPKELRESDEIRTDVKARVEEMMKKFAV